MVKQIDVHVGHGKTGSSYLQNSLAMSADKLKEQGIDYPVIDAEISYAKKGILTKGNFTHLDKVSDLRPKADRLLLSSETLFHPLWSGSLGAELRQHYPDARINILLFVRNPIENVASSYMQAVQKGMDNKPFEEFLPRFNRPQEVVKAIEECKQWDFSYEISNFSKSRSRILEVFAEWINCAPLHKPQVKVANRTITVSEAELLIRLGSKLPPRSTNRLGSILCAKLPDIKADKPTVSKSAMNEFEKRMREQIAEANRVIGREIYEIDDSDVYISNKPRTEFSFNDTQLEIIAEVISESWKR